MKQQELFSQINAGILEERAFILRRNAEKNHLLIARWCGLQPIIGSFRAKNVIIVGAGPSLEGALPVLTELVKDPANVLVSVDMALRPLLKNNIYPQFAITCETKPADFFSGLDTSNIRLLSFSCASVSNLRSWKGKYSFFNWLLHGDFYDSLWDITGHDLGFVPTASVVTTQAISLVLGCSPALLFLIGNDLGFEKQYYARQTIGAERHYSRISRIATLETLEREIIWRNRDYVLKRGRRQFYTSHQLLAAKYWLEDLLGKLNVPTYDASLPGLSEKVVRHILPSDIPHIIKEVKK